MRAQTDSGLVRMETGFGVTCVGVGDMNERLFTISEMSTLLSVRAFSRQLGSLWRSPDNFCVIDYARSA